MRIWDGPADFTRQYDVVVASCGYERRSTYLARSGLEGSRKLALVYGGPRTRVTEDNLRLLRCHGWEVHEYSSAGGTLSQCRAGCHRICVDISSMPRHVLADIVQWMWCLLQADDVEVDFMYAPGEFKSSKLAAQQDEVLTAGPVSAFFRGDVRSPTFPIGLMVGLGLEPHRGLGLIEFLEPARIWALSGIGCDPRFDETLLGLQRELPSVDTDIVLMNYDVLSLGSLFVAIENVVFSKSHDMRMILAPSGPKILSLACLLVSASTDSYRPAVWRVGAGAEGTGVDVVESGEVALGRVSFG
jgi:hypothetical protein